MRVVPLSLLTKSLGILSKIESHKQPMRCDALPCIAMQRQDMLSLGSQHAISDRPSFVPPRTRRTRQYGQGRLYMTIFLFPGPVCGVCYLPHNLADAQPCQATSPNLMEWPAKSQDFSSTCRVICLATCPVKPQLVRSHATQLGC